MTADELAAAWVAADQATRVELLAREQSLLNQDLAYALKSLFYDTRVSDPARARQISEALMALAEFTQNPQITALACWVTGIVALEIDGTSGEHTSELQSH